MFQPPLLFLGDRPNTLILTSTLFNLRMAESFPFVTFVCLLHARLGFVSSFSCYYAVRNEIVLQGVINDGQCHSEGVNSQELSGTLQNFSCH